jgi:ABC-type Mn2+/Zn2+ transport system permease subunit
LLEESDSLHGVQDLTTQADLEQMSQMTEFLYDHMPYFLTAQDYARIDSLLHTPDYVPRQLARCKELLLFPVSGVSADMIQRDPLNLFTPVLMRLRQQGGMADFQDADGYLVSSDGRRAIVMMRSAFGASETEHNAQLIELLQRVAASTQEQFSDVDIRFIGGPVIAVGNARQIKTDSLLSVSLAVVLIVALLFFVFRRVWPLLLIVISIVVLVALLVLWRPLSFDSLDPDVAAARGVPSRFVSLAFMVLLGLTVAVSVQIIGALLVLALLVTPAAAALRVSSSPVLVPVLSMLFGFVSAVGGILLAIGGSLPISPYITTISFLIYLVCRIVGRRTASGRRGRRAPVGETRHAQVA